MNPVVSTMQEHQLTITDILRHGATVYADSVVTTWEGDTSRSATYAEVAARAERLAGALTSLGIEQGDRVGTFMWNNQEHLEAYLAIPSMGAVLHTLNIRLFPEQVTYIANHAQDKVVICDGSLAELLGGVLEAFETVEHVIVTGDADWSALEGKGAELHRYDEVLAAQPEAFDWPEVDERDAAAMCYTSGTTGNPKGVVYSHRSVTLHSMGAAMWDAMGLTPSDKVLAIVPQFHAMSWGIPYAAMMVGASLVMPDRFLQPEPLLAMMREARPTFSGAVPTIWQALLQLDPTPRLEDLERVICGGSAVPEALIRAFDERFGVPIIQAWGMTETSPLASIARLPADAPADADEQYAIRAKAGRVVPLVEFRLDEEAGGELQVSGPTIASSYYDDDTSPEKFTDDGWLRTGDVAEVDDGGWIRLVDRTKDLVKSGGEWISSVELENEIMAHPQVKEAAVIGIRDEKWGERPLACVVAEDGEELSADDVREFLDGRVAKWWIPESIEFIDEVPKTSVGKFSKKTLRERFAEVAT